MSYEKDPNELGCLWEKQGKHGTYFTGKIGDQAVVVFKNGNKREGSKAPDWRVMKPVKQDREQDQRPTPPSVSDEDIAF